MMLGFLLARMGVDVMVLEKHADFLRDFRGDTIHPSTLDLMHELGILRRRIFPTKVTQWIQVTAQNRVIRPVLGSSSPVPIPWALKMLDRWSYLRRIPARIVGVGVRPEHVRTPEAAY